MKKRKVTEYCGISQGSSYFDVTAHPRLVESVRARLLATAVIKISIESFFIFIKFNGCL